MMKASDLRLEELVSFSDGLISLQGRRLIMHDVHAMAQLRKDLIDTIGVENSRRILARFGYYWGEADAAAMKRMMEWDSLQELLTAGSRLHGIAGVVSAEIKRLDLSDERLYCEVVWHNSAEAEEQLLELGASPEAGCWIQQGYASGYASLCLGRPVYFVESSCRARGDRTCFVEGRDADSWGERASELERVYQVDDIRSKIHELTIALRRNELELARHRKRIRMIELGGEDDAVGLADHRSKSFQEVLDMARRVARFDTSVLITGESGVGKEVVARFIHAHSPRQGHPFVTINCGALPETLLESELFGHRAGSFTDAVRDRSGMFEEAEGGTILLDEIGDMSPALQVKLLRVLQDKQVRRVGENQSRRVDTRVIAATNRRLDDEVNDGNFRDDLFYRLRVVEVHIPPLRERPEDILPLARLFTQRIAGRLKLKRLQLHTSCIPALEDYDWPGNVRELENALERAAVMSDDGWIRAEQLPATVRDVAARSSVGLGSLRDIEREHVRRVLTATNGNKTQAARILGISNTTLWRKIKQDSAPG